MTKKYLKEGFTRSKTDIEKMESKIDDFIKITNGDKDSLYKYLMSPYQDIRLGSIEAGEYINERFNDDFYLRRAQRAQIEYDEYIRSKKGISGSLHY